MERVSAKRTLKAARWKSRFPASRRPYPAGPTSPHFLSPDFRGEGVSPRAEELDIGETVELFFTMLTTAFGRLRLIGFLEGISYLLLLGVAVPLKYIAGEPMAVRSVGMAHGILFLLYLLAMVPVGVDRRWNWKTFALGVLASVLPAGPFVFDAKVLRPPALRR